MSSSSSSSSSKTKSFFRVILCSTLTHHKLRFPDKFVKIYGDELSDSIRLMVPTSGIWCVKLETIDKTIWLHEGMEKFMEDHSLRLGYFLIFKYKGNSTFKVRIFDLSVFEIEYRNMNDSAAPGDEQNNVHNDNSNDENDSDSSIEILDSSTDRQLRRSGASAERLRVNRSYLTRSKTNRIRDEVLPVSSGEANRKITSSKNRKNSLKKKSNEAANLSLPINPCYSVTMKQYNIYSYILHLPLEFAKLFTPNTTMFVKLQEDTDENEWQVRYINSTGGHCLSKGWGAFVKAKKLMVGDVCVFEPSKINEEVTLKVKILRAQRVCIES